jgi:uncharacterized protein YkwD
MRLPWALVAASLALAACAHTTGGAGGALAARSAVSLEDDPTLPSRFHKPVSAAALDAGLFDEAVLVYVNRTRAAAGRPPLKLDGRLHRAAQGHAANMAHLRMHSHRLPVEGQGRLVHRMDRQGVRYRVAGENIAMEKLYRLAGRPISLRAEGCRFTYADTRETVPLHTYATLAQAAVARWMASPKHRESMLRKDFQRIGSGLGVDTAGPACGDVYLVQNFAD